MYVHQHVILALIASLILLPFVKIFALIVFLAAIFIDTDHYLCYLFEHKDVSLKNAYRYFYSNPKKIHLYIFHTVEFWILLAILSIFTPFFLAILIGIFLHIIQDLVYHLQHPRSLKYKPYSLMVYLRKT
jgi:ABC-type antimicrobial peptide transport system permease subunit